MAKVGGTMVRAYNKTRRASKEQETHRRILDAALTLYGSVGPSETTISSVAETASVQRLTVYRHFPKETDLLAKSLSHWFEQNPMPDPVKWREDVAAENWPIAILSMLYSYYEETAGFWPSVLADRTKFPELDALLKNHDNRLSEMKTDVLMHLPKRRRDSMLCRAVVHHAVQFSTWYSLAENDLDTVELAALMEDWIQRCPVG